MFLVQNKGKRTEGETIDPVPGPSRAPVGIILPIPEIIDVSSSDDSIIFLGSSGDVVESRQDNERDIVELSRSIMLVDRELAVVRGRNRYFRGLVNR